MTRSHGKLAKIPSETAGWPLDRALQMDLAGRESGGAGWTKSSETAQKQP